MNMNCYDRQHQLFWRLLDIYQDTALNLFQEVKCSQEREVHIIQFKLLYNSEQAGEIKDLMWHLVQCIEVRCNCNCMERWVFVLFTAKCCFVEFSTPSSMQYAIVCAVKSSSSSCVRKYKSVQLWGVCAGTVVWCARTATVEGIPDVGGVLGIPLPPNISPKHTLTPPSSHFHFYNFYLFH